MIPESLWVVPALQQGLTGLIAAHPSLWAILAFLIGALSGFQGIYDRYEREPWSALSTAAGLFYVVIRGLIPATVFLVELGLHLINLPPPVEALVLGAGTEALLRARFATSFKKAADPQSLKGPLDLVFWLQDTFFKSIGPALVGRRSSYVEKYLPGDKSFEELCDLIEGNAAYLADDRASPDNADKARQEMKAGVIKYVQDLRTEFMALSAPSQSDKDRFRKKLGSGVYMKVTRSDFRHLMGR